LLEFLEQRGIRPGAQLHVSQRNYDGTLTLTTDAGAVALGSSAAEKVWVTTGDRRPRRPSASN
jgi:Fe2+ transport system protein FeoA